MITDSDRNLLGISVDSSKAGAGILPPRKKRDPSTQQTSSNTCRVSSAAPARQTLETPSTLR